MSRGDSGAERLRAPGRRPHLSTFVGRAAELEAIAGMLRAGERLVTITGTSGVGKSRLASRAADDALALFGGTGGGGVWRCEIGDAADADAVCRVVAEALGVPLHSGGTSADTTAQLGRAIQGRGRALLLLDGFEAVAPLADQTVARWLSQAPEVQLLVTSQELLRLEGEIAFDLGPLGLPGGDDDVVSAESVQLLLDRVRRIRRDFELGQGDAAAIGAIVRELDGIPLAIELAAARMSVLGPVAILERLSDRFELLRRGETTLQGAIDWSYGLCAPHEQDALAQCSIFRGGFTVEAAEEVVLVPGGPPVLDLLQALREKSLLRVLEARASPPRLALYSSIRAYAEKKLGAERGIDLARRHTAWALRIGERLAREVEEAGEPLERLSALQEDLAAVVERSLAVRPPAPRSVATALRALLVLDPLRGTRGPALPHLRQLDLALAPEVEVDPALRASALTARARLERLRGRNAEAIADLENAFAIASRLGDAALVARTASALGMTRFAQGRAEEAEALLEGALERHEAAADVRASGFALAWLAVLHLERERHVAAREHLDRALVALRRTGDRQREAFATWVLGLVEHDEGHADAARRAYREALAIARALGERWYEGACLAQLGILAHGEGGLEESRDLLDRACRLFEGVDPRVHGLVLGHLGGIEASLGRPEAAERHLRAGGLLLGATDCASMIAALELQWGRLDLALARVARSAEAAAEHRRAARSRIEAATRTWAVPPLDVRLSLRLLEREVDSDERASHCGRPLVVQSEGLWFSPPSGARVGCKKRQALRTILVHLARRRLDAPGEPTSTERLLAIGWPGERILPSAARNRLYVTMATLRRLGLRDVLLANGDGYLLSPEVPLRIVRDR